MWVQKVPGGGVDALAFAPDGRTLYTYDRGGWVTAWDVAARVGRRLFAFRNTRPYPPGLFVTAAGGFAVVYQDSAALWDVGAGAGPGKLRFEYAGRRLAPDRAGEAITQMAAAPPRISPTPVSLCIRRLRP